MKKIGLGLLFLGLFIAVLWVTREKVRLDRQLQKDQNTDQGTTIVRSNEALPFKEKAPLEETITFDQVNQCVAKRLEQAPDCAQTIAADLLAFVAENLSSYKYQTTPDIEAERERSKKRIVKECKMSPGEAERLLKLDLSGC